ncbi:hypothetical protein [Desulfosporosinus hippei]|uniref:Uncharacterized protein n=1 Tax=Desulfosporosinus hippei DSM 8344 TaxID=1121419 RepID=A0A1G7UK77_9FIRM|nr:hypothetical protein [Desulfosporosinus hippei]SDG47499.1 hypothetical protein SAMN05443529_103159 [Desulfosporosinus hippei DSM 8344]
MAETVKNLFLKARALLDELTDDGVLIPEDEVIDMQSKAVLLGDMAHKELYEQSRLDSTKDEPDTFTSIDDTTEVNYKADQAITYYIAARLAPFENKELVNFFEDKYEQLKRKSINKATEVAITDVYAPTEEDS